MVLLLLLLLLLLLPINESGKAPTHSTAEQHFCRKYTTCIAF
jgi:hypothetical protein